MEILIVLMELFLGIIVLFGLLFLGALISRGNERQRQAIDGLREQTQAWAEQDIRIKREKLARQISVTEPLAWLEKTAALPWAARPKLVTVTPWQKDGLTALSAIVPGWPPPGLYAGSARTLSESPEGEEQRGALAGMSGTAAG